MDSIKCLEAINNVQQDIQGHDPRGWMKACAQETLMKLGGPDDFKKCLENKIKHTIKDCEDPKGYAESLYNEIKGKCK